MKIIILTTVLYVLLLSVTRTNTEAFLKDAPKPVQLKYPVSCETGSRLLQLKSLEEKTDTVLSKKREQILKDFSLSALEIKDTLFDLNFDGYADYVIRYYGAAGTGLKNRVEVYLFSPQKKDYIRSEQLSKLSNPSFYMKEKRITSFYIGSSGGNGCVIEWKRDKWKITKKFDVSNEDERTTWFVFYPLEKRKEQLHLPFRMIPPEEVVEVKIQDI